MRDQVAQDSHLHEASLEGWAILCWRGANATQEHFHQRLSVLHEPKTHLSHLLWENSSFITVKQLCCHSHWLLKDIKGRYLFWASHLGYNFPFRFSYHDVSFWSCNCNLVSLIGVGGSQDQYFLAPNQKVGRHDIMPRIISGGAWTAEEVPL